MSRNMVNFGLLAAEILSLVWGTPANFNGFRVLAALLHGTVVVGVSQTAAFDRGKPRPRRRCVRRGRSSHPYPKAAQSPVFSPCLLWPNGWMAEDTTW